MAGWISVKDQLPEDDVWVRCRSDDGKTFYAFHCGRLHPSCWFRADRNHIGNLRVVYGITHWRPK